jgi:hypothetical protein
LFLNQPADDFVGLSQTGSQVSQHLYSQAVLLPEQLLEDLRFHDQNVAFFFHHGVDRTGLAEQGSHLSEEIAFLQKVNGDLLQPGLLVEADAPFWMMYIPEQPCPSSKRRVPGENTRPNLLKRR